MKKKTRVRIATLYVHFRSLLPHLVTLEISGTNRKYYICTSLEGRRKVSYEGNFPSFHTENAPLLDILIVTVIELDIGMK